MKGNYHMKQDIKLVRKQFRMTMAEEKLIKERMAEEKIASFSDYLRKYLFTNGATDMIADHWFSLWRSQKLEQISRDIHALLSIAQGSQSITSGHVSILLTCVQELITEVEKTTPLSQDFRDKYRQ